MRAGRVRSDASDVRAMPLGADARRLRLGPPAHSRARSRAVTDTRARTGPRAEFTRRVPPRWRDQTVSPAIARATAHIRTLRQVGARRHSVRTYKLCKCSSLSNTFAYYGYWIGGVITDCEYSMIIDY